MNSVTLSWTIEPAAQSIRRSPGSKPGALRAKPERAVGRSDGHAYCCMLLGRASRNHGGHKEDQCDTSRRVPPSDVSQIGCLAVPTVTFRSTPLGGAESVVHRYRHISVRVLRREEGARGPQHMESQEQPVRGLRIAGLARAWRAPLQTRHPPRGHAPRPYVVGRTCTAIPFRV